VLVVLLLVLAALLGAAAFEVARVVRARAPAVPRAIELRADAGGSEPIADLPKVLWTYWATAPVPPFVAQCLDNWRRFAPGHEIRLIHRDIVGEWLGEAWDADAFDALPPFRQADWLRLQLLMRHGGLWVDASTLFTRGLAWVHDRYAALGGRGVVGFYIDRYTLDPAQPMIENWFIAASPRDPFIAAWIAELDRALALGESGYIDLLRSRGELAAAAQGIPEGMQAYLVMHLAAARVSRQRPDLRRMSLVRAEDSAYAFHAGVGWRKRHLFARLALTPEPGPTALPALIKLRSGDRAVVERGLARGLCLRSSLLARLLTP
jgi:hypothetical protein